MELVGRRGAAKQLDTRPWEFDGHGVKQDQHLKVIPEFENNSQKEPPAKRRPHGNRVGTPQFRSASRPRGRGGLVSHTRPDDGEPQEPLEERRARSLSARGAGCSRSSADESAGAAGRAARTEPECPWRRLLEKQRG